MTDKENTNDRQGVALSEREAFEAALPFIGGVMHVFSTSALFEPRDGRTYLEGTTEICWRTWLAARASSSRAEVESVVSAAKHVLGLYGKGMSSLPIGSEKRSAWLALRDALAAAEAPKGGAKP